MTGLTGKGLAGMLVLVFGALALSPSIAQAEEQGAFDSVFSFLQATRPFASGSVGVLVIEDVGNSLIDADDEVVEFEEEYNEGLSLIADTGIAIGGVFRLGGIGWLFNSSFVRDNDEDLDPRTKYESLSGGVFIGMQVGSVEGSEFQGGIFDTGIIYLDYGLIRTREEKERDDVITKNRYTTHMIRIGGDWGLEALNIGLSQNIRVGVSTAIGITPADIVPNVWHIGTTIGLRF